MIRATTKALSETEAKAAQELARLAAARIQQGLAPPAEIYQAQYRSKIDWADFPEWARPLDPEAFDDCCHEG